MSTTATQSAPASGGDRDPWYDNARWLAGSLVVALHLSSSGLYFASGSAGEFLSAALKPARVPLFAILGGLFTPVEPQRRDHANLVRTVITPLALFTLLHIGLSAALGHERLFTANRAQYTLWFLVGVVVWRLIGPLLMRLRFPLLFAIGASVLVGSFDGYHHFEANRIIGHLPFVVVGMQLRGWAHILRLRSRRSTIAAAAVLAALLLYVIIQWWRDGIELSRLGFQNVYPDGSAGNISGALLRLAFVAAMIACSLAILHLTPRKRIPLLSYVGSGGFGIFLIHGLVLRILWEWGIFTDGQGASVWRTLAMYCWGFALAALLGSRPVRWAMRPILRPKLAWALRPETSPEHRWGSELTPPVRGR